MLDSMRSKVARSAHARQERKIYPDNELMNANLRMDSCVDLTVGLFVLRMTLRAPRAAPRYMGSKQRPLQVQDTSGASKVKITGTIIMLPRIRLKGLGRRDASAMPIIERTAIAVASSLFLA